MPLDRATGTMNLGHRKARNPSARMIAWAAQEMAEMDAAAPQPEDGWTPKAAGEQLVAALKWARYAAGRTGPAGMVYARLPETILTDEEFLEMGWGIRETADDPNDLPPMRIMPTPAQISRHLAALEWPAVYLVGEGREGTARMVGLWAACRAYRRPFNAAVKERGVHRSLAYQLRDRGLSIISQGLARDGVGVDL